MSVITDTLASEFSISKVDAVRIANRVMELVFDTAAAEGKCRVGMHYFKKVNRSERKYRDIHTGEQKTAPARTYIKYSKAVPDTNG